MSIKSYKSKLNKFIELCKQQQAGYSNFSASKKSEFEENAIAIFSNNNLASKKITSNVAKYFLFLINPKLVREYEERKAVIL